MAPWELALSIAVGVAFVGLFVGVSLKNARRRRRMERAWRRYAADNGFETVDLPVSERLTGTGPRFALERTVGEVAVRIEHVAAKGGEGSSSGASPALTRVSGTVQRSLPPDLWLHASRSPLPYSISRVTTGDATVDRTFVVQAEPPDAGELLGRRCLEGLGRLAAVVDPALQLTRGTYDPDHAYEGVDRPTAQLQWPGHDPSAECLSLATRVVVDLCTGE